MSEDRIIWYAPDPENPRIVVSEDLDAQELPFIVYDLDAPVVFSLNTEQALSVVGSIEDDKLELLLTMQLTHQKQLRKLLGLPETT